MVPTALAGALQGAAAALLAAGAMLAVLRVYGDDVIASLSSSLGSIELMIPAGVELALFVAAGATIGLVGGALAGASRVAR